MRVTEVNISTEDLVRFLEGSPSSQERAHPVRAEARPEGTSPHPSRPRPGGNYTVPHSVAR